MRVEILCTGNELLDGSVVDTNSAWFEARLFALGEEVREKRVVPDRLETIADAMREIAARADFCLVSGGLGPTPDDLSFEALAAAAGVGLVEHAPTLERLRGFAAARGRTLSPNQSRQAQVPEGATVIANDFGTAPHVQMRVGRCHFALLPGVPREFTALCEAHVLPLLAERLRETERTFHAFAQLRCYGIWEADMAWLVRELPQRFPGLRLGTRTHLPENHLKLRASAATQAEAEAVLATAVAEARARLGTKVFEVGERSFAEVTLDALRTCGATVALAESVTGGLCAALLSEPPGASEVFQGSLVTYATEQKITLLGLDRGLIERQGVVSEAVAREMAERARTRTGATYGASVTGWAGPAGGDARSPLGTVWAALASERGTRAEHHLFSHFDRDRIRRSAAYVVLNLLRRAALGEPA